MRVVVTGCLVFLSAAVPARQTVLRPAPAEAIEQARKNGLVFEQSVAAAQRVLRVWLTHADPRTLLLPDRLDADRSKWILQSATADGMLYNEVDAETLAPLDTRLSDNWGYVYGAVYTYYQVTGDTAYRDAVGRVLVNLPKYRKYVWEPHNPSENLPLGSFDGYADAIESAIYLVNREAVPQAFDWIDSEMQVMLGMQRPDGHIENWYGEGNFNRTALLYAYMKSLGVRPARWEPGVRVGAVRDGARLIVSLATPAPRRIQFDFARHARVMNLQQNYVRLNEFPEWFTVDENTLYRIGRAGTPGEIRLGSELIAGVTLGSGEWIVEELGRVAGFGQAPDEPR